MLLVTIFFSGLANADVAEQGFSGEIGFLTGYANLNSNFNTEQAVKNGVLNSDGHSDESFVSFPLGQLRYQFSEHQLFIGVSEDDIIKGVAAFELGYKNHLTTDSALSFSYLPTLASGETWSDPFVTSVKREKTDVDGNAYRVKYEFLNLVTDFVYYDRDIDNEKSASTTAVDTSLLKRDGTGYLARVAVSLPLSSSSFIEPAVFYREDSADGKAMAYDLLGAGMAYMFIQGNSQFSIYTQYSTAEFDAINPVFNQKREDSHLDINLAYEYIGAFGISNLSLSSIISYGKTDSNINFYDEENFAVLVGSSFSF